MSAGPHHGVADVPAGADWLADSDESVHPQNSLYEAYRRLVHFLYHHRFSHHP